MQPDFNLYCEEYMNMKKRILTILSILSVFTAILLSASVLMVPKAQSETSAAAVFSGDRAMKHVESIAADVHIIGSNAQFAARDYIVAELAKIGLAAEVQEGPVANEEEGFLGLVPYSGTAQNIVARIPGSAPVTGGTVLLMAHYDSTAGGPGASDDASGCAVLLETARAMLAGGKLQNDVILLFADGEEAGLLGSTMYASQEEVLGDIGMVMNFEGRGSGGPSMLFETSDQNGALVPIVLRTVPGTVAYSFCLDAYSLAPNITDLTPFLEKGLSGLNFANLGGTEVYHMPEDTAERLDPGFLQHQGEYALGLAQYFAGHASTDTAAGGNAVFFTLMRECTVWYPSYLTPVFTVLAVILAAAAVIFACRKKFVTAGEIGKGAGATLLAIAGSAVFGVGAALLFGALYVRLDAVHSSNDLLTLKRTVLAANGIWIIVSLVIFVAAHLLIGYLWNSRIGKFGMLIGNLVVWALAATASAFILPNAQYIFLWPLAGCAIGVLTELFAARGNSRRSGLYAMFAGVFCSLIFLPVGYILFQALMMSGSYAAFAVLALPAATVMTGFCSLFFRERSTVRNAEGKAAASRNSES